jgi:hypothetical protein
MVIACPGPIVVQKLDIRTGVAQKLKIARQHFDRKGNCSRPYITQHAVARLSLNRRIGVISPKQGGLDDDSRF